MELWDLYDINRVKTGKFMERGTKAENGILHLIIHACIFGTDGRMLIQQRQTDKKGWPNMWDITVSGCAVSGEDTQMAASRELKEELGIDVDFAGVRPQLTMNFDYGFDDFFLIEKDVDLSEIKIQAEEVQQVKWATREEIKLMIADSTFIPYYTALIDLLFDSRASYGAVMKKIK